MDANLDQRSEAKWKEAALGGFQIVPDILLKKQVDLGLTPTEMLVLINIMMHWWYADQRPFPRTTTIATRMGSDQRTVQRAVRKLQESGLVERVVEELADGTKRTVCDLSGLIAKLNQLVTTDKDYLARKVKRDGFGISRGANEVPF
ncbi:hypothetical protein RirG_027050 [Rhizophagus irregularis DAOM 197198w]|uniref:Uncharacterized protein n=1 Tax=Rhizophagus irregularis (strain DAOM 197198w) TaxID=1432141 RepID=A0A015LBM9_RHIIW|nr:hypothetical protein RirG_027050 [Rhizophagus irregularis DAOM 197198w]